MENRSLALRRKIALLRGYLREGVSPEIEIMLLRDIGEAEAELRRIGDQRSPWFEAGPGRDPLKAP